MLIGPPHPGAGRLVIPPPSAAHGVRPKRFSPRSFYSSTQLDNFSGQCGFGVNETTIAQSTANPDFLVAGANTYYDGSGACQDSHAGVYYSSDGGQHWRFEVMPGLEFPASGDPVVTFDPVRQVFVFAFVEFKRHDDTQGRIGVEVSSDGVNWARNVTLDSNNASYGTDKPSIAVDQDPSSPHFGRVLVAWTDFHGNNAVYQTAFTDDGGVHWTGGDFSVNQAGHECGNGTSAAFDAAGEAMVAWADCSGGTNSIYEELSTDGGATWGSGIDHQITITHPIETAENNTSGGCLLDNGGSAFRCNSFPTLAGDPNGGDAGTHAFFVAWSDVRTTAQGSQTANISQVMSLSTVDGTAWDHLAFVNFNNFGDKFFPAASFAPSGRLTVSYSSREDDASSGNPTGKQFDEHQTEAASLTSLRNASYVSYTTDGTPGDPGTLTFIGDYAGNTSLDENADTFPVWTDLRSGFPSARTQDVCYSDCPTFLSPGAPRFVSQTTGSSFTDFYGLSMDPTTGSGSNFWNVVGIRSGTDGTTIDDDAFLSGNHYYNTALASSSFGPPLNDYVLINGNFGHALDTVYFPQAHSFSTHGGSYSIEWTAGHLVVATSQADAMTAADVVRVYDTFLASATTYYVSLRPAPGNTSNYSLTLHSGVNGSEQGRSQAVSDSSVAPPGTPAFVHYATGADPGQFDGIVVLNNNGGSGTYTLYRDSAAPTGSLTIDNGAKSTKSTTLNLSLSATNPTAGDPVSDMALSVNGGPFGAFQPYSTSATLNVPSGDGNKTVSVEYRNGAGAVSTPLTASIYLVTKPPTMTNVTPRSGATSGGKAVTIYGTHFAPGAKVLFGTTKATSVTFVSASKLQVVTPAHAAGTVRIIVTTPAGTTPSSSADLYAFGAPTITSLSPNGGAASGGNTLSIFGTGFVPGAKIVFGTVPAATVTFVSSTKLQTVVPSGLPVGSVRVIVKTVAGSSPSNPVDLYGVGAPKVTSITPTSGSTAGGNTVTVNGFGFASGATVKFGTTAATSVTVVSGTKLAAHAPAHAAGTVDLRVTTAAGTSAATSSDHYNYS